MIEPERSTMASPNPSIESLYIIRMDDDEHMPTPGVGGQGTGFPFRFRGGVFLSQIKPLSRETKRQHI